MSDSPTRAEDRLAEIERRLDDLEGAVTVLAAGPPDEAPDALDAAFKRLKGRAQERKERARERGASE